jgi:hypothetical protein
MINALKLTLIFLVLFDSPATFASLQNSSLNQVSHFASGIFRADLWQHSRSLVPGCERATGFGLGRSMHDNLFSVSPSRSRGQLAFNMVGDRSALGICGLFTRKLECFILFVPNSPPLTRYRHVHGRISISRLIDRLQFLEPIHQRFFRCTYQAAEALQLLHGGNSATRGFVPAVKHFVIFLINAFEVASYFENICLFLNNYS